MEDCLWWKMTFEWRLLWWGTNFDGTQYHLLNNVTYQYACKRPRFDEYGYQYMDMELYWYRHWNFVPIPISKDIDANTEKDTTRIWVLVERYNVVAVVIFVALHIVFSSCQQMCICPLVVCVGGEGGWDVIFMPKQTSLRLTFRFGWVGVLAISTFCAFSLSQSLMIFIVYLKRRLFLCDWVADDALAVHGTDSSADEKENDDEADG